MFAVQCLLAGTSCGQADKNPKDTFRSLAHFPVNKRVQWTAIVTVGPVTKEGEIKMAMKLRKEK